MLRSNEYESWEVKVYVIVFLNVHALDKREQKLLRVDES